MKILSKIIAGVLFIGVIALWACVIGWLGPIFLIASTPYGDKPQ